MIPAMFLSVLIGYIGLHAKIYEQRINGRRNDTFLLDLEQNKIPSITSLHFSGILTAFSKGALMAAVLIPAGTLFCGSISILPDSLFEGMSYASMMMIGTVSASALLFYHSKGKIKSLILGSLGGFTWILVTILTTG